MQIVWEAAPLRYKSHSGHHPFALDGLFFVSRRLAHLADALRRLEFKNIPIVGLKVILLVIYAEREIGVGRII